MTTYDEQPWPTLAPAALHGPIGDFVNAASPYTEADPAALLGTALTYGGLLLSEVNAALRLGDARHGPNLFVAIIGRTSKARKGTASRQVSPVATMLRPDFDENSRVSGFGSGEALIKTIGNSRLVLIEEQELTRVLRVAAREGNVLGQIIRLGWDGAPLERRTVKESNLVLGRYALSIVGHATVEELRTLISSGDVYGGTVNRFLWFCAQRTALHPDGGNVPTEVITAFHAALAQAHETLKNEAEDGNNWVVDIGLSTEATVRWRELYKQLGDDDPPGILGAAISRSEPQVLRIALVFALVAGRIEIDVADLRAAMAVWKYSRDSAAYLFGMTTGHPRADRLYAAIHASEAKGIATEDLYRVLGTRDVEQGEMDRWLQLLTSSGLIVGRSEPTGGRPRTVWRSAAHAQRPRRRFTRTGNSEA